MQATTACPRVAADECNNTNAFALHMLRSSVCSLTVQQSKGHCNGVCNPPLDIPMLAECPDPLLPSEQAQALLAQCQLFPHDSSWNVYKRLTDRLVS
eukprot:364358-Chlamydomonas_euryale.AAC.12